MMEFSRFLLVSSALLCSLVAGLALTFSIIVMPGIRTLSDHDFLRAFQVIDRVIQNGQPVFGIVWLGSVVSLIGATVLGFGSWENADRIMATAALALWLFGVQLPTMAINVPLNNQLQAQELHSLGESALREARTTFEPRWVTWNHIRTVLAVAASLLLILLCLRA